VLCRLWPSIVVSSEIAHPDDVKIAYLEVERDRCIEAVASRIPLHRQR
jgi:hypothetical protein